MKRATIIVCAAFLLWGCATSTTNLRQISLGMDKRQIEQELGEPTAVRGAIRNIYGQAIEVWEYRLAIPKDGGEIASISALSVFTLGISAIVEFANPEKKDYWLYFYDEKLAKWGQAGDWSVEADRIYMIDFSTAPSLTR